MSRYDDWISEDKKSRIRALHPRIAEELRVIIVAQTCPDNVHIALGVARMLKDAASEKLLSAVLDLLKAGSKTDEDLRAAALETLPQLDSTGEKTLQALAAGLDSDSEIVWCAAAGALAELGLMPEAVVAKIKKHFAGMRYRKKAALGTLQQFGPLAIDATDLIVEALWDDDCGEDAWQALETVNPADATKRGLPPNVALQRAVDTDFAEKSLNALMRQVPAEELADEPQIAAHLDEPEIALAHDLTAAFLGSGRDFLQTYGSDLKGSCQLFLSELTDPELIKSAAHKLEQLADTGNYSEAVVVECLLGCLEDVDDLNVESAILAALDAIVRLSLPTPKPTRLPDFLK